MQGYRARSKKSIRAPIVAAILTFLASESLANSTNQFYYEKATDRYFTTANSSFSIRPVEDPRYLEKIEISIDNSEFKTYSGKIQFAEEGVHNIRFRSADPVLNWSPIQHFRVYVDSTPPSASVTWDGVTHQGKAGVFVQPKTLLRINAQDNLSGVSKILWEKDGKINKFKDAVTFNKEGPVKLRYKVEDRVGNQSPWQELAFEVDSTKPKTVARVEGFSYQTKKALFVNSSSFITLNGEDSGAGVKTVEFQINKGPVTAYQSPIAPFGREMVLKYRSVDFVGNKEKWKSITVFQDTTAPKLAIKREGRHVTVAGKIYARPGFKISTISSDKDSGLKEVLFTRDGSKFEKLTKSEFKFDQPGEYYLVVKATDHVGNLEESNPYSIVIDQTPPTSRFESTHKLVEKGGIFLSGIPNKLEVFGEDNGVGLDFVEISFDGKKFKKMDKTIDLATWKSPKQTLFYRSVDRLGNRETPKKMDIHIRTRAPIVDLFVENKDLPDVPLSQLRKGSKRRLASQPVDTEPEPEAEAAAKPSKKAKTKKKLKRKAKKKTKKRKKRKPASKKKKKK